MKARFWHVRVFVLPSARHRACNKNTPLAMITCAWPCCTATKNLQGPRPVLVGSSAHQRHLESSVAPQNRCRITEWWTALLLRCKAIRCW